VITGATVIGRAQGETVAILPIDGQHVARVISTVNALLNRLTNQPMNDWRTYNLANLFGTVPTPSKRFKATNVLEPQEQTCIRLSDLVYFHHIGLKKVDHLICAIAIDLGAQEKSYQYPIALTPYACKGEYVFPVRGTVTIMGLPWNFGLGHRGAVSQEFAFDVVDYRRLAGGALSLSSPPGSNRVTDYFAFHREVHAIGAGTVVAAGNSWPDKWANNPTKYSVKRVTRLTSKLLKRGVPFNHAILGNYAIIDHHNGEFSLYAHMSEGSVGSSPALSADGFSGVSVGKRSSDHVR
jgi:murein DD-endopeptidase MepM/ murein hydrolase activator NlpD